MPAPLLAARNTRRVGWPSGCDDLWWGSLKITKYGHCCMLVEEKDSRILIDPGNFTEGKDGEKMEF
jgi:hypothetical protein